MPIEGRYLATAYGPPWNSMEGTGTTARGTKLAASPSPMMRGPYIIAVDPSVIPYGSQVYVWPNPFDYRGTFLADDTGGAIKGRHIDFYDPRGRADQNAWGARTVNVSLSDRSPPAPWARGGTDFRQDLGPGGPINFGGADTGSNPLNSIWSGLVGMLSKLLNIKTILGILLLLVGLVRIAGIV